MATAAKRLSIFPLPRAILFPRLQLPLHIFEPRYRAMISNAMASDQRIGMIQPSGPGDPPPLFPVGCIGKVSDIEALDDGRFNIVLTGISRFRVVEEMAVTTPFRQVQAVPMSEEQDDTGILSAIERGALEDSARRNGWVIVSTGRRCAGSMTKPLSTASRRSDHSIPPPNRPCSKRTA